MFPQWFDEQFPAITGSNTKMRVTTVRIDQRSFRPKHLRCGLATSCRAFKSSCACPTKEKWHWFLLPQEDLCPSASLYSYAKYHLWNLGPGYHTGRLEELLILNRPCRLREDVKDSVLLQSYWQAWKKWESTKKEIEIKATKIGVIWFVDENEVVQHILEVISRDEIAMAVTYQEAQEHDTFKEGRATKRRRKDGSTSKAPSSSAWRDESKVIQEHSETTCWKRSTESRVDITESLFHCFTSGGLLVFCFAFVCVLVVCEAVFVVFVWWLVFPFFKHLMHKVVIHPRLSPSSWWAQHRSKIKSTWHQKIRRW